MAENKGHANLKPIHDTERAKEVGALGGAAKKGSKHLSTIIQELADNIDWSKTTLNNKDELAKKYGKNGFKAMAYVAFTKAMTGDTKAMEWLAKNANPQDEGGVNINLVQNILNQYGVRGGVVDDVPTVDQITSGSSEGTT